MNDDDRRAVKLLQGYIWHPLDADIDLARYLPRRLEPDVHVLWDPIPMPPLPSSTTVP